MTYVVAARRFGRMAFVADSRLSKPDASERTTAGGRKTGILFPGCIYGISGDIRRGGDCLRILESAAAGSPASSWRNLVSRVERYPFVINSEAEHFDILLSTRHEGSPQLFHLSSVTEKLTPVAADVYSIGSGVHLAGLDDNVKRYINVRLSPAKIEETLG